MEIKDLKEKMVAVLGFGQEGRAVTEYLLKHGIKPMVFDQKRWDEWSGQDKKYIESLGTSFVFDPDWIKEFKGFDVAFRSPGIKLDCVAQALGLQKDGQTQYSSPRNYNGQATSFANDTWQAKGLHYSKYDTIITSQTKWFFEHCPAKIIGVTGTKGKGTTASLIFDILQANSHKLPFDSAQDKIAKSYLTGNIGKVQPLDFLDDLTGDDWVVYELSSFQLQDLDRSPHIGVVLMTTQEHLDYHRDTEEYLCAKEAVVKFQSKKDFAVINVDFEGSIKIGESGEGKKLYFSRRKEIAPGCFIKNGAIAANWPASAVICRKENLQLKGEHNLENACAAVLACLAAGVESGVIGEAVKNFKGLEHRLEFVAEKQGIKFYNDSFSTVPETAIAAVKSFSGPLIAILGGSSKNSDFTELGIVLAQANNLKEVILIGQEAGKIKAAMDHAGGIKTKILEGAQNMQEIFGQIRSVAKPGDTVLLSPACASFGMFENYKDRGEQFKKAVFTNY